MIAYEVQARVREGGEGGDDATLLLHGGGAALAAPRSRQASCLCCLSTVGSRMAEFRVFFFLGISAPCLRRAAPTYKSGRIVLRALHPSGSCLP